MLPVYGCRGTGVVGAVAFLVEVVALVGVEVAIGDLWGARTGPPALTWSFRRLVHIR